MSLCSVLVLLAAVVVVMVGGQIPIPKREVGFVYGSGQASASVHLDFYIDLICPDSKVSLPTMLKVADFYGPDSLQLTTHLFPLPYHRVGFYAAKVCLCCSFVWFCLYGSSTVFHSMNSPHNSSLSHSVLPVLFLP